MSIGLFAFGCLMILLLCLMLYGQATLSELRDRRIREEYEEELSRLKEVNKGVIERLQREKEYLDGCG